ncbi:hypothetical protein KR054_011956, partial [Drosophila jambulina]
GKDFNFRLYPRWWSGGVSGAISQAITTPLDLIESRMVATGKEKGTIKSVQRAIHTHGFLSLYDGLVAQVLRQLTYTTMRFHLYELGKSHVNECSFLVKVSIATLSGCVAGLVGIPLEVVNTRMHVDRALPRYQRRNYRNVFDGLYRMARDEGYRALYSSFVLTCLRSAVTTIGQNAIYDQVKLFLILILINVITYVQVKEQYMQYFDLEHDSTLLHLMSSVTAVCVFGPVIQPVENIRTIKMVNNLSLRDSISQLMRYGPLGPFRGMVPAMLRLMPNTIITLLLYEKFRVNFGYYGMHA